MRKIDWKGICELIAVLCTGMGLGMEICINKFSIDKSEMIFMVHFKCQCLRLQLLPTSYDLDTKNKKYHVALLYKHKTFALRIA